MKARLSRPPSLFLHLSVRLPFFFSRLSVWLPFFFSRLCARLASFFSHLFTPLAAFASFVPPRPAPLGFFVSLAPPRPARRVLVASFALLLPLFGLAGFAHTGQCAGAFDKKHAITVVSREEGSGTRGAFVELFALAERTPTGGRKDLTSKEAIIANKTDVMMLTIANDPHAIGYISLGSLNPSVKALAVDGVPPSASTVKDGRYAVARPFRIVVKGAPSGLAKDFIDFILSKEGQAVAAKNYVAMADDAAPYAGGGATGRITVAGSSSVSPLMEKLQEAYAVKNPAAVVEVQMSDSTAGITGAVTGACDIGMSSRSLKESEKARLTDIPIAIDGLAVIVHPDNPLTGLGSAEVKAVFTGTSTVWSDLVK